jgi:hypothetical protein
MQMAAPIQTLAAQRQHQQVKATAVQRTIRAQHKAGTVQGLMPTQQQKALPLPLLVKLMLMTMMMAATAAIVTMGSTPAKAVKQLQTLQDTQRGLAMQRQAMELVLGRGRRLMGS